MTPTYPTKLNPRTIAGDCLITAKSMAVRNTFSALDCSTPKVRQAFAKISQDHLNMADEVFRLMQKRGWYAVQEAVPQHLSQVASEFQATTGGWMQGQA